MYALENGFSDNEWTGFWVAIVTGPIPIIPHQLEHPQETFSFQPNNNGSSSLGFRWWWW